MFTFDDLCSQALGAADYRAIAEHYSTVIVTDIPIMTEKHSNQAKRFINMIDEFYEHKTKLICTAEAEPEKLYQATGGVIFEFARTVSRLNEMRSQQYLVG
jgi:cell division protein ZapE